MELIPNYDGIGTLFENRGCKSSLVAFGQIRYKPGGYCGPRFQRKYLLVLLHSGECEALLNGIQLRLKLGTVYLFLPGHREFFRFSTKQETFHSWCHFAPKLMPPSWRPILKRGPFMAPCSDVFNRIMSTAFSFGVIRAEGAGRVVNSLGQALFSEFLNMAHSSLKKGDQDEWVNRAVYHMEDHFSEENCLRNSLRAAGCSRNALIYKFRQQLEMTPARYLWKLRIEKGLSMLVQTGLNISEIGYRCGFKNPFHFSRSIRLSQGLSPRAVRQKAWK